jgi:hypothetical protein
MPTTPVRTLPQMNTVGKLAPLAALPKPTALHWDTSGSLLKVAPEFLLRLSPPLLSGIQTSPSTPGTVRGLVDPPAPGLEACANDTPPSVLTSTLPVPVS